MQNVVITGGTGGLGSAIASTLRDHGWHVEAPGSRDLDVRSQESITSYFQGKSVDLLICAAGITRDALLSRQTPETWDEVMEVNFEGAKRCALAAIPGMNSKTGAQVLFISSYSALHPPIGQVAYAASKAALLGLTSELASAFGASGLRVNAILPGFLETPMTNDLTDERRQEILNDHRLDRFNTPEAVASFIRVLHEELLHTSGQVFQLDSRFSSLC